MVDANRKPRKRGAALVPITRRQEEPRTAFVGQLWAQRLTLWDGELDRLRWAENLPSLPYPGTNEKPHPHPRRRKELERVFTAVASLLDDSPARTLYRRDRIRSDIVGTVEFAKQQLRDGLDMMNTDPFPKAVRVVEVLQARLANLPAANAQGRSRAAQLSHGDLLMFKLVREALEQWESTYRLESRRLSLFQTSRRIAAEVLDLPEHAIRRSLR